MKEHTKEKLTVYREYLVNYLSVMCERPDINVIRIVEPFAGPGRDENNEQGSALLAAYIIKGFRERKKKDIRLFLNELDQGNHKSLEDSMKPYEDFVYIANHKASKFLDMASETLTKNTRYSHNLFFLDPYGYTQYSHKNLNDLLNLGKSDYLIFMPTHNIYRFHGVADNPARRFVLDFGIGENVLNDMKNIDSFAEQLTNQLKSKANTNYGYNYKLINQDASNNIFHLFFITKHPLGAKKFLEAVEKIRSKLKNQQMTLFDSAPPEIIKKLEEILKTEKTNHELNDQMIINGQLPKKYTGILKQLESDGMLSMKSDFDRRKGAFYFNDKNGRTIHIILKSK